MFTQVSALVDACPLLRVGMGRTVITSVETRYFAATTFALAVMMCHAHYWHATEMTNYD